MNAFVSRSNGLYERTLGIGFFGTASAPFLPRLVCSYRRKFPDVQLRLYELTPNQQLDAFDDGRIDIEFTRKLPPDRRKEFEEENIYTDELGIALPRSHPLTRQKMIRLKALAGEALVQFHRKGERSIR